MGASYLKSFAGIPIQQLENNASYIQGWLEKLKKDRKFIVHASAQAQKAVDYILGVKEVEREVDLKQELLIDLTMETKREMELKGIRDKNKINERVMER